MTKYPEQTAGGFGNKPLALVIEDDLHLANIFATALVRAGFHAEIIGDGQQALQRLAVTIPTLVLLDLHLPHVSGGDILHSMRKDARLAETRVILATADAVRAELLYKEADLVLLKPISFQQLRDLAGRLHPPDVMGY